MNNKKVDKEPLKKSTSIELTELEKRLLEELAVVEGTNIRNVLRRALKEHSKKFGFDWPEEAFSDRQKGNWLQKKHQENS